MRARRVRINVVLVHLFFSNSDLGCYHQIRKAHRRHFAIRLLTRWETWDA